MAENKKEANNGRTTKMLNPHDQRNLVLKYGHTSIANLKRIDHTVHTSNAPALYRLLNRVQPHAGLTHSNEDKARACRYVSATGVCH